MRDFERRLQALSPALLKGLRRGVEKESLRARRDGRLAQTPHPRALGSAAAHPHITTDFSEAQLELVTGVHASIAGCLAELNDLHRFVAARIGDETMWCASMPCRLPAEDEIPIAQYGSSNAGRLRTLYRVGLSHRYGRRMQTVSGIHYNFSLPLAAWPLPGLPDADAAYLALMRNFRRHAWLLLYLMGASPAACRSFVAGRPHELLELAPETVYLPHATSLRMGPLGYVSAAQDSLAVTFNSLAGHTAAIEAALARPYPPYEAIGMREGDEYRQLATTLLQIENELYSTIRAKRIARPGERLLHALRERGIEYVEVRTIDLNPFAAAGIDAPAMRFLDVFLLHCLLADSPPDDAGEIAAIARNNRRVAARGREPGLRLERTDRLVEMREWAGQLLAGSERIATALDSAHGGSDYTAALAAAVRALDEPESLPSARVLREMVARHGGSHLRFVEEWSEIHRRELLANPLAPSVTARLEALAAASHAEQRRIESADELPFEVYLRRYLAPDTLVVR